MNKPIEEIIEITGLEKNQIEKIRDEKQQIFNCNNKNIVL